MVLYTHSTEPEVTHDIHFMYYYYRLNKGLFVCNMALCQGGKAKTIHFQELSLKPDLEVCLSVALLLERTSPAHDKNMGSGSQLS